MHLSKLDGAHRDDPRFFPDRGPKEMDYRQKMVVAPHQKYKREEEDDDEDLEALRLAALQSLRAKDTMQSKRQTVSTLQATQHLQQQQHHHHQQQQHQHHALYKGPRLVPRRGFYGSRQQRQNGNLYYHSPRNPNLIAIVPVEEEATVQPIVPPVSNRAEGERIERSAGEDSKFYRYKDNASGSEDDESRTPRFKSNLPLPNRVINEEPATDRTKPDDSVRTKEDSSESHRPEKESGETKENFSNKEHRSAPEGSPRQPEDASDAEEEEEEEEEAQEEEEEASEEDEEEEEERQNDDDDDVLLMADLEEEDSLERLMDEMEREMNVDKPMSEKRERKASERNAARTSRKVAGEEKCPAKSQKSKARATESARSDSPSIRSSPASSGQCGEKRSASPHGAARPAHKRRSLSPRLRSRKKSPRRSPPSRRSPSRPTKKAVRELPPRFRSPRKSPPRFSPRPRSPRLSPLRRSPIRSPVRRGGSPPRGRSSPRRSHSRSPLSRTSLRSRSPARRSRSPARISPRSRSPKLSPRSSPPPRRGSSLRPRSPKLSPRRSPPSRLRSPRLSPHRSPWSSPRRRRSPPPPKWSPKESSRRSRPRSVTPEAPASPYLKKETSPLFRSRASPVETTRSKAKQREEAATAAQVSMDTAKNSRDGFSDPVLEARRKKFECTKPIDPLQANKKIKLSKESGKKRTVAEDVPNTSVNVRRGNAIEEEEPDSTEADLCLDTDDYVFEDLEDEEREATKISGGSSDAEQQPVKVEKERPSKKKKKKRDKELYQVGKLKGELPLSERIGKEKKKKRKDVVPDDGPSEQPETPVFEDLAIDEEGDLRTELSRRRAERLNRTAPVQSARLLQSAFKGVVNEVAKSNAKVNRRHVVKGDEKSSQKEVRRVTVLHRTTADLHDSEDETNTAATLDSKVPVRFRLGINKAQDTRLDPAPAKASRKTSKRQGRKVKHKNNLTLTDPEHAL